MAYEANAELHNVQLHNQKNVGGRRPRMTPNVRNYDQEQKVILNLSAGFDRAFGVVLCIVHAHVTQKLCHDCKRVCRCLAPAFS